MTKYPAFLASTLRSVFNTSRLLSLLCCTALPLQANADEYISLYSGQGLNHNFRELPSVALKGELEFEPSWLAAVAYKRDCATLSWVESIGISAYCEGILVKHSGLQHNWESDLAYQLVSPPWQLSAVDLHLTAAIGASYAFGTPSYEDGPLDNPEKRYRFQNFNAYELMIKPRQKNWYSFLRIHHRSGIYGLVAPRNVGSNFLALGISYRLNN